MVKYVCQTNTWRINMEKTIKILTQQLHKDLKKIPQTSSLAATEYCSDIIVPGMEEIRKNADLLEKLTAKNYWPYPIYSDLLFY